MEARRRHLEELAGSLRRRLIERRRAAAAAGDLPVGELEDEVRELVGEEAALLAAGDREAVVARILRDTVGLGPLEDLLADPAVEEVMVNGPDRVYVERAGRIEPVDAVFADEEELRNAIERILAPLGRRVDELSPMVDARLADGSRVNVVIPPLQSTARRSRSAASGRGARVPPSWSSWGRSPSRSGRCSSAPWRPAAASWSAAAPDRARRPCSTPSPATSRRASGW